MQEHIHPFDRRVRPRRRVHHVRRSVLMEVLNAKCVEDIANQKIVAPLVETLLMVNQGQGLGVS